MHLALFSFLSSTLTASLRCYPSYQTIHQIVHARMLPCIRPFSSARLRSGSRRQQALQAASGLAFQLLLEEPK